jgi:hypothetical protein
MHITVHHVGKGVKDPAIASGDTGISDPDTHRRRV